MTGKSYFITRISKMKDVRMIHWQTVLWMIVCSEPTAVYAQLSGPTIPAAIASISTDTGDLAPGPTQYTRYTTPLMCVDAAERTQKTWRRTLAAQAVLRVNRETPERDTLPAQVARVARACGMRFTVAATAREDLPDLLTLALLADDDAQAHAALVRLLALAPSEIERERVLDSAIMKYTTAEPARNAAVDSLIAQADAQGRRALVWRIGLRFLVLMRLQEGGSVWSGESPRLTLMADQIIALSEQLTSQELSTSPAFDYAKRKQSNFWMLDGNWPGGWVVAAFRAKMQYLFITHPDSMLALARQAQRFFRHPEATAYIDSLKVPRGPLSPPINPGFMTLPADSAVSAVIEGPFSAGHYGVLPHQTPRLTADFWFPGAHDSLSPHPGMVSLVVGLFCVRDFYDDDFSMKLREPQCMDAIDDVQRWLRRYGTDRLAITVLADNSGSALLHGPQPPDEEAKTIAWYVQHYWKFPVSVAVQNYPYTIEPPPTGDGRRTLGRAPEYEGTSPNSPTMLVLTDTAGHEVFSGNVEDAGQFDAILGHTMVGTPPAAPSPTTVRGHQ